ncbi:MAG: protein kinase, partial [Deltaproteobacteria bacterium]|nr:protein kinase [Deltaproteobacteria bacterium]
APLVERGGTAGACLDYNDAAECASGALTGPQAARVEGHLAGCRDCRALVAALAGGHEDSEVATAPRPARLPRGKRRRDVGLEPTLPRGPTDEPEVAVGDTIGRYVVLSRLGAGGMGVVWSAYDPQLDRKVALKLLRAGTGLESSEGRTRLIREAQAIAQLSHPHVVAVYDVGTTEASGEVYIAMEFVEGETLSAWMARWERPWREILDHFLQAGRGLAAAHGTGLLHRDFKPDNVLVGTDGRVRVTDFGLARSLITAAQEDNRGAPTAMMASLRATLTATGTVLGTPRYMAPEQLRGKDTDARSDQFSFCIALYEALYGQHPLPGTTAIQMVEQQAKAIPPPEGQVPAFIGKALMRGLDAEPARRFPSMHTLLHELTPPPSRTRERWLGAGLGAVLLVGGGAAAVVALGSATPSSQQDQLVREVGILHAQIDAIRRERDELLDKIKNGMPTAEQFQALKDKIAQQDRQIEGLMQQIADLSTDAGAPAPPPRKPPPPLPPPVVGLSKAQVEAELRKIDFDFCSYEWRERNVGQELKLTARMVIGTEGHPSPPSLDGTDDVALGLCLKGRLLRTAFPPGPAETSVVVGLIIRDADTQVGAEITGVRLPAAIDPADIVRP